MAATKKMPAFFKFYDPEFSLHSLNLPLSFTSYMKGMLPDKVLLRDKIGNLWSVKVLKIRNEYLFEEGWVKFVADNGVSLGNFLVFKYDGGNIFDFKLLGPTACEKDSIATCSIGVKEEREENEEETRENEVTGVKEVKNEEDEENDIDEMEVEEEDDEEDDDDNTFTVDDYSYESEEDEEDDNDDKDSEEDEEDDNDEDYDKEEDIETNVNISRKEAKSSSMCVQRVVTSTRRKAPLKIEAELEKSRPDLAAAGLLPSNAPYLISQVRQKKRQELYIPLELIRDHSLDIPDEMIIRSKDGKEFPSRISSWGDGRKIATNGWRAFCRWYFVKQDERCLCIPCQTRGYRFMSSTYRPGNGCQGQDLVYKKAKSLDFVLELVVSMILRTDDMNYVYVIHFSLF